MIIINEILKKLRKAKGCTQREVADYLEINQVSYARFESGENQPSKKSLVKIADFFNCTTDYLLGRTNHPQPLLSDVSEEIRDTMEIIQQAFDEGFSKKDIQKIIKLLSDWKQEEK